MLTTIPDRTYRFAALALMALLGALVLLTFRHYGVSWDEELQSQYGQAIYDYYASFFVDRRYDEIFNLHLYGGMFDGLAAYMNALFPIATVYQTRHLLNALLGLTGLWGTWRLGRLLGGGFTGFAAMALLALMPSYYGHMFNNPKDIPFAAGIVWSLYYMAKSLMAYPGGRLSVLLKLGIVFGLTLGVRVNGVMVLGIWLGVLGLLALAQTRPLTARSFLQMSWRVARIAFPACFVAYAFMLACWPWAQEAPLANPLAAIVEFSNFPQIVEVLFNGKTYLSTDLPWYYVPLFFFVQMPLLHLLAVSCGVLGAPLVWRETLKSQGKRAAFGLLLLSSVVPVGYAMARHPALYDAVRHFTFVLPLLFIAGALGIQLFVPKVLKALRRIPGGGLRLAVTAGLWLALLGLALLPLNAMIRLHPYEYIYINEIEGGVQRDFGRFELDYWGMSFKEAAEKLQAQVAAEGGVPSGKIYKIAICGPWAAATIYLPPDYEAVGANEPADFFMATTRWMCQNMRGGREIVRVERLGAPLSVIKDLRGTEDGRLGMPNYRREQEEKEKEDAKRRP